MNKLRLLEWVCRWIAGGIFIWASINKITVPCELARDVYLYHLAPGWIINLVAIVLPYIEIILGVCLIVGVAPRGAALGIILMLCFFLVLLTINLVRGLDFECGCFGAGERDWCMVFSKWLGNHYPDLGKNLLIRIRTGCDIIRDIFFLVSAIIAFRLLSKRLGNRQ